MATKQIGIRLSMAELASLRRLPGESDSARVRALIHNHAISTGLAEEISAAVVTALHDKNSGPMTLEAIKAALARFADEIINADKIHTRKLAEAINEPLTEILARLRNGQERA